MASFVILVHSGHFSAQSSRSALKFAQAVIKQGHQLKAVFFYQDGVYHANTLPQVPSDELETHSGFKQFTTTHNIPLLLCVTAGEKRGVIEQHNIDDAFTLAGLAEMAAMVAQSDRLVQFS